MTKNIFNDEWILESKLGEGHTSKVYKVKHIKTGELAALKIIKNSYLDKPDALSNLENEITIMNALRKNQNVVKYIDSGTDGKVNLGQTQIHNLTWIMMEYVEGGLLFDLC